ncbi:MAG: recombinase family protein, partial [Acidimicrobiales bacterium]
MPKRSSPRPGGQAVAEDGALAVSYLRFSTKEQAERGGRDEGFSLPAQREANQRKAESLNAVIVEEFIEPGESGTSTDRPALQRLLAYVKTHPVAYCIVHKIDRLARNRLDDAMIHYELRQAGVMLVSATENIDETPSGMLVHGIMSSIAEFYSVNLATEVTKGMVQKAAAGGTPTRAPVGYLNVRKRDELGREIRTVEVDPERSPHVIWAFQAYASGNWTTSMIHEQLIARGLTTLPTPRRAAKPLALSSVQRMLTNPYYKGDVTYKGVTYAGAHQPIVPTEVWYRVQTLLAAHNSAGDRRRRHDHYLQGTVYCGACGSRLMISNARSARGPIYPYFVCAGRHAKRTNCTRPAILMGTVEQLVADHYKAIQIPPDVRRAMLGMLDEEFAALHASSEAERHQLTVERDRIQDQRRASLQAHYAGALPLDLLKEEQDRLAHKLDLVTARLEALDTTYEEARTHLQECLALAGDCHSVYACGSDTTRRMANQAFFTRIYLDADDQITAEPTPSYRLLLDPAVQRQALTWATLHHNGKKRPTRIPASQDEGSSKTHQVELRGLEPLTPCLQTTGSPSTRVHSCRSPSSSVRPRPGGSA